MCMMLKKKTVRDEREALFLPFRLYRQCHGAILVPGSSSLSKKWLIQFTKISSALVAVFMCLYVEGVGEGGGRGGGVIMHVELNPPQWERDYDKLLLRSQEGRSRGGWSEQIFSLCAWNKVTAVNQIHCNATCWQWQQMRRWKNKMTQGKIYCMWRHQTAKKILKKLENVNLVIKIDTGHELAAVTFCGTFNIIVFNQLHKTLKKSNAQIVWVCLNSN